jgi:hypothetical protein
MNKKYNIQEFIDNDNLVIKCNDLFELRKVGKYLWNCSTFKIENFNPTTGPDYPYIVWYSKTGTNFNPLRVKYPKQIIINFEDVIFEEFVLPEKWCIKITDTNVEYFKSLANYKSYNLGSWSSITGLNSASDTRNVDKNHIEITFDQFKEYVLKESKDNYDYLIKYLKKLNIK